LVAGDFNALAGEGSQGASSAGARLPVQLTAQWVDTYGAVSEGSGGFTCCVDDLNSGPDEPLEKRIDYLFLVPGGGIRIVNSQRVFDQPHRIEGNWQWVSDHVGLLVTMEW
jgi:endonuclease/exonuclease/phosphatase family metal-dependent hydrolase